MNRRTKALSISATVKRKVYERDNRCCILCGSPFAAPNAHYISRGQGGLGIEQNIVTLCNECHRRYDQTPERPYYGERIEEYLKSKYANWNKEDLIYKKEI